MVPLAAFFGAAPLQPLNDSAAFNVAVSRKLGRMGDTAGGANKDINTSAPASLKEKYECTRDSNCNPDQKCSPSSNKCAPICSVVSCSGSTPHCLAQTPHSYSCRQCLSDTHCAAGKQCSGYSCTNCPRGSSCRCPSGKVADGNGGCYDPCAGKSCPGGYCSGGSCHCYGSDSWNGSSCVPPDPCAGKSCPGGYCSGGVCYCETGSAWNGSECVKQKGGCSDEEIAAGTQDNDVCRSLCASKCNRMYSASPQQGWGGINRQYLYEYSRMGMVCTGYRKSCGYNCTTGWDIKYAGYPWTCQIAVQQ